VEGVTRVISSADAVAIAFNAIAPEYEAQLAQNPVASFMRRRLHRHFREAFHAGDRVLDLAAGTGLDSTFLASLGIRVVALDASSAMMMELERKARMRSLAIDTHVLQIEELATLGLSNLDGAISTFGGLNTVHGMSALAAELSRCIKPKGRLIFHALNRFCLWQVVRSGIHGRISFQRATAIKVGANVISLRFFEPFRLWRDAFARDFVIRDAYAMSVVASPTVIRRFPHTASTLFALDSITGRLLPGAGDFFVLDLEKRHA
jgi:2-polyprenyl-3-methyl-5-hydroxy-6-metoxy-1,4-benzoquinol methylase